MSDHQHFQDEDTEDADHFVRRSQRKATPVTRYVPYTTPNRQATSGKTPTRQNTSKTPNRQTPGPTSSYSARHATPSSSTPGRTRGSTKAMTPARAALQQTMENMSKPRSTSLASYQFQPTMFRVAEPQRVIDEMTAAGRTIYLKLEKLKRWNDALDEYLEQADELQPATYQEVAQRHAAQEKQRTKFNDLIQKYRHFRSDDEL